MPFFKRVLCLPVGKPVDQFHDPDHVQDGPKEQANCIVGTDNEVIPVDGCEEQIDAWHKQQPAGSKAGIIKSFPADIENSHMRHRVAERNHHRCNAKPNRTLSANSKKTRYR